MADSVWVRTRTSTLLWAAQTGGQLSLQCHLSWLTRNKHTFLKSEAVIRHGTENCSKVEKIHGKRE